MEYRQLGLSGLNVSVVGIGTHQFGGEWGVVEQHEVTAILRKGREMGINLVETAASYGRHRAEQLIGKALQGERNEWVVATKFGQEYDPRSGKATVDFSVKAVQRQLEDSLRSLRTDHIDLYQFHSGPNDAFADEALWEFLRKQVELGKVKHLGVSLGHDLVARDDDDQLLRAQEIGIVAVQIVYNRLVTEAEELVLPFCRTNRMGVIARVPLAKGILGGRYGVDHVFSPDDYRSSFAADLNADLLRQADQIKRTELPADVSLPQWAIAWCLAHQAVDTVVVGSRNVSQVASNASACKLKLKRRS